MGGRAKAIMLCALLLAGIHLPGCADATRYVGVELNEEAFIIEGVPSIRQSPELSCGPACVASVATYWTHEIPPNLREIVAPFQKGDTSATDLCGAAKTLGLDAFAFCGTLEDLEVSVRKGRPVIVMAYCGDIGDTVIPLPYYPTIKRLLCDLWPPKHWTVVIGTIGDEWFVIQDPDAGRYQVRKERLMSGWKRNHCAMVLLAPRALQASVPGP
jgi:ABC-type bacteriocin/lantibiotic exporter with double-glycine peptidase domain